MKRKNIGYVLLAGSLLFGFAVANSASAADVNKLAEGCANCHGKDGANGESDVPNIGGYSAKYLTITLDHYKKKERPCVETKVRSGDKKGTKSDMCQVVKDLSDDDIKQLSQHFAGKKFVRTAQKFDAALAAKGKGIHDKSCEKCHSEAASLADDDAGILAGQKTHYLKEQTEFFLAGKRPMHKKMEPKLKALSKEEIEAVLHYYASLQ
ncbi:MAG: c-type cytochrome [Nitrosomonadales bacterium]|nr:c-type cytochrome [Nitrosomonadales bacterium]